MNIQKEFTIRYRGTGHIRFQIPARLCHEGIAETVSTEVLKIEGVYQVKLFRKQKKLSIRYKDVVCDFKQLAAQLFELLSVLEEKGLLAIPTAKDDSALTSKWNLKAKVQDWKSTRWVSNKMDDAKDTVKAAKILTKIGLKKQGALIKDPEKALIDFFNDILVLYLIKLHWTRITQEWIPKPWAFRYQWTAVFYLFYLLMRSRKPK